MNGITGAPVHSGSWFGLPDFGFTELLGQVAASKSGNADISRTAQGGSNLFGGTPVAQGQPVTPQTAPNVISQDQMASNFNFSPSNVLGAQDQAPTTNTAPSNTGSGAPAQTAPSVAPQNTEIDNMYNSNMNYLNGLEGSLRANQPGIENEINSNYNTGVGNLGRSQQVASGQIDQSQQAGVQRQQDAITAARNLYNELVMGGHQRFGGASSAGEAYQALAGRELQKNNQQIGTDYSNFMGQIAQARNGLNMQYQNSLSTLEQQRQSALSQAQRDFQDKLNQINGMRNDANNAKASARLNALTDLRNQIFQINLATAQNSQAVQNYAQQLHDQLTQYENAANSSTQTAQSGQQGFAGATTTNPTTGLTMNGGAQAQNPQMIGMTTPNKDQQLIGAISPFDPRNQRLFATA